jgi:hypothetical protein
MQYRVMKLDQHILIVTLHIYCKFEANTFSSFRNIQIHVKISGLAESILLVSHLHNSPIFRKYIMCMCFYCLVLDSRSLMMPHVILLSIVLIIKLMYYLEENLKLLRLYASSDSILYVNSFRPLVSI